MLVNLLGNVTDHPIGVALGSPFKQFESPFGLNGLCWVEGMTLHLLALDSKQKGAFRAFIQEAKNQYAVINVWEIWNPWLGGVLERYGFKPVTGTLHGDQVEGMRWPHY
jgi:hypothetical protein